MPRHVIDVIGAFTTAAYAFGAGASEIYLAAKTLALGPEHCDPTDIQLAATVHAVDLALEVERAELGRRLTPRPS